MARNGDRKEIARTVVAGGVEVVTIEVEVVDGGARFPARYDVPVSAGDFARWLPTLDPEAQERAYKHFLVGVDLKARADARKCRKTAKRDAAA